MSRQKQIVITDEILAQIEEVTKTSVSADDIVVFEAAALSTNPISQRGSLYDGARTSRQMLVEAAQALNTGSESVPLHTMHQNSIEIPVGRVFRASVHDEIDGSSTLRAMFYLPRAEQELVEKINLGVLDEVSVGIKSKEARCSKCGFDYFGDDVDFSYFWLATCENDHTIGVDGTHLRLTGLDRWVELSLVSRGASDKPKILSRPKQILSEETYDRLAASGKPVEALVLYASQKMEPSFMSKLPEDFDLVAQFEALTAKVEALSAAPNAALEAKDTELTELQASITAKDAELAELQASVEAKDTELSTAQTGLSEKDAEIEELKAAIEAKDAELATASEKIAALTPPAAGIPLGGVAASMIGDHQSQRPVPSAAAFKTKQRR